MVCAGPVGWFSYSFIGFKSPSFCCHGVELVAFVLASTDDLVSTVHPVLLNLNETLMLMRTLQAFSIKPVSYQQSHGIMLTS